jgi:eukaryotic-like serine/threonine-protein kinase
VTDKADRWHQVEEICHAALERLPGDRAAFLREACAGDDGMRREVEALLANSSRAEVFLEQPVAAVAAQVMQSSDDALTGRRLNALVIGPLIGAGGMGRVYRARDAELHRDVAVKVLPPEFAHDADRLARFTREARVLASLNHPNIAQIHGLENTGDTTALVMELVEGETLADRIARGPIAADEALLIARQITEGLEAAHEQGVIHRDLKPANIRLRPDGMVKVLDFGLAKAIHQALDHADDMTAALSTPDAIVGTAAYMAPEQAKGKPADRRVDLWALGCILFEMLSGRPAFAGETLSDVLVRVIEREPNWETLPVTTPAAIRRLLHNCLEKNARRRLDSAAVARIEIDDAAIEPARVVPGGDSGARRGSVWRPVAWATTGAGVSLLLAMIITGVGRRSERPASLVVMSVVAAGLPLGPPGVHFSVAPNGRTVVFSGTYGTTQVLFRRDLDRVDPQPIVGSVNGMDVFFSPDSRWIGFERPGELWTTLLDGGSPQRLLPNHPLRGGTWGEGGTIIVGRVGSGLWMASATRGESRQLTVPPEGERHELPQMLPGGRAVLFTILSTKGPPRVAVHLLETGESRALFEGIGARFVGSGHVVFGRLGKLWAVGFDPGTLQPRGEARQVIDDVLWSAPGYPQFALDADLLAYVRASQTSTKLGTSVPILMDRQGKAQARPLAADNFGMGRFSPGGDRIVFQVGAARDLWIYELRLGTFAKLTSDRIIAFSAPLWTPDGKRVIFMTWFDGEVGLGWLPADGSGPVGALVKGVGMRSFDGAHPVMLPDGSGVILTGLAPGASIEDLLIVRFTGEKRLETLFQAPGVERNPAIAPNGRFIAYNSNESGHPEVYVRPFPNVGARRWQVSTEGGAFPVWTRGGGELVYEDTQGRIMAAAVRVEVADEFEFSKPEPLFTSGTGIGDGRHRGFDVTADGERFLFNEARPTTERAVELILIQNWADELRRLVPREP